MAARRRDLDLQGKIFRSRPNCTDDVCSYDERKENWFFCCCCCFVCGVFFFVFFFFVFFFLGGGGWVFSVRAILQPQSTTAL